MTNFAESPAFANSHGGCSISANVDIEKDTQVTRYGLEPQADAGSLAYARELSLGT